MTDKLLEAARGYDTADVIGVAFNKIVNKKLEAAEAELERLRELETAAAEVYVRRDALYPTEDSAATDEAMRLLWRRIRSLGWYFPESAYKAFKFKRDEDALSKLSEGK